MTEPLPGNRPLGGADEARGVGPAPASGGARADKADGTEFQALLDELGERARDLAARSRAVEKPEELAGAVDSARESLEDVLSLKDQLLEAYEQAKRQGPGGEGRG